MTIQEQIKNHFAAQTETKRGDLQQLHKLILKTSPKPKLSFHDGKNSEGKTVSNPTIGYGSYLHKTADGKERDMFRIGLSANTTGISIYILGLPDKTHLAKTYAKQLGKAKVTGYCIKFKTLQDINLDTLAAAIRFGLALD